MTETRIKGQEVVVMLTRERRIETTLTAVKSFTWQVDRKILEEGYLSETQNRHDDIVDGSSGSLELAIEGVEYLRFIEFLTRRSQRDASIDLTNSAVNIVARFAFANGTRPKLIFRDRKFENIPVNSPGRAEFVMSTLTWKGPVPKLIEG